MARFYVNRLGRFSATDPAACARDRDPQHLNRYPYVSNDPANSVDPTGKDLFGLGISITLGRTFDRGVDVCQGDIWCEAQIYARTNLDTYLDIGGGLLFSLCQGTTDCSYYGQQCKKAKTLTSIAYYCFGAPFVCRITRYSGLANCVRLCLQQQDNCLNLPDDEFPACEESNHAFCDLYCGVACSI
jgi:hypothetical protein